MSINIIKYTGTTNTHYHPLGRNIEFIALHYTAGTRSTKGSAKNVASMFKAGSVNGSADFIVDDVDIVQYNGDIIHRACWAVGGNRWISKSTSEAAKFYGICGNRNSISIEMCSNKVNKSSLDAYDTDWYFTEETINNAVKLTKYLMKRYNIPLDRVIMHHHVTGKVCPNPWCVKQDRLNKWNEFKKRLTTKVPVKEVDDEVVTETYIKINGKDIKINRILKDGKNYIDLRGLEKAGFKVGFEPNSKLPTLENDFIEQKVKYGDLDTTVEAINVKDHLIVPARSLCKVLDKGIDFKDNTLIIKD